MGRYFLQDTPHASFERIMMKPPNSEHCDSEEIIHIGSNQNALAQKQLMKPGNNCISNTAEMEEEVIS